ncbi:MAG: carbohydrate-binding family 9-like protein [Myxococcales bacterium]|jgi:hypothetical protein|nr:carbohydrate-binding family 9-like protein [Myxococcales bacterium]
MNRSSLLCLSLPRPLSLFWMLCLTLACSDPSAPAPPPRHLSQAEQAEVDRHLLQERPNPQFPASIEMGHGRLRYLGTSLRSADRGEGKATSKSFQRGERVRAAHYFEVLETLEGDGGSWKIFLHVAPERSKKTLINADHFPVLGLWSTRHWKKGDLIEDTHDFTIPESAPDRLVGWLGLYRLDRRMKVDARQNHDGRDRIRAFQIDVTGTRPVPKDLPSYRAKKRTGPIEVDGRLDDAGWQAAPWTEPFRRTGDGKKPHFSTRAKLSWDDEALYVAFEVEDRDIWATHTERDAPIYEEEVVEIFIDADGDGRTYDELQLSPRGVQFDAAFTGRRQGMNLGWDSGMTSAVHLRGTLDDASDRDEGWSAEMRIPVDRLTDVPRWPPRPGDRWRVNLYRLEWHSERKRNEGSAFSPPLVGDFHHLPRFGWLEFE